MVYMCMLCVGTKVRENKHYSKYCVLNTGPKQTSVSITGIEIKPLTERKRIHVKPEVKYFPKTACFIPLTQEQFSQTNHFKFVNQRHSFIYI